MSHIRLAIAVGIVVLLVPCLATATILNLALVDRFMGNGIVAVEQNSDSASLPGT